MRNSFHGLRRLLCCIVLARKRQVLADGISTTLSLRAMLSFKNFVGNELEVFSLDSSTVQLIAASGDSYLSWSRFRMTIPRQFYRALINQ
jgi:hypothetical protein